MAQAWRIAGLPRAVGAYAVMRAHIGRMHRRRRSHAAGCTDLHGADSDPGTAHEADASKFEALRASASVARGLHVAARQRRVEEMMVPSTVAIPEMHLSVLAGVFHPVALAWIVATVVVIVVAGLCAAIAIQGPEHVDGARGERPASERPLRVARRASEREGVAAA